MAMKQVAHVTIHWCEFSNEQIDPEMEPDVGWYIDIDTTQGTAVLGPDCYGPGLATLDEALAMVEKWAAQRGLVLRWQPYFSTDSVVLGAAYLSRQSAAMAPTAGQVSS